MGVDHPGERGLWAGPGRACRVWSRGQVGQVDGAGWRVCRTQTLDPGRGLAETLSWGFGDSRVTSPTCWAVSLLCSETLKLCLSEPQFPPLQNVASDHGSPISEAGIVFAKYLVWCRGWVTHHDIPLGHCYSWCFHLHQDFRGARSRPM